LSFRNKSGIDYIGLRGKEEVKLITGKGINESFGGVFLNICIAGWFNLHNGGEKAAS
jgi:hypothetical protein